MNVLILGSGGREHAFAWKVSQSSLCKKLLVAPGNAGTAQIGTNIEIGVNDFDKIKDLCLSEEIDLLIVGPEDPLVNGIYDFFQEDEKIQHITVIGPSKKGAQLEGSKEFSKEFMVKYKNYLQFKGVIDKKRTLELEIQGCEVYLSTSSWSLPDFQAPPTSLSKTVPVIPPNTEADCDSAAPKFQ